MTPHIEASKEAIAPIVIMPGDPKRAEFIANKYLDNPKLVTNIRNMSGYTGTYKNNKVTIMASGMGMPSMGIYAYELFQFYDVKKIIRIGSCGSLNKNIKINDLILATSAYTLSNFAYAYDKDKTKTISSSKELNNKILDSSKKLNINIIPGPINTSDVFYHDYIDKKVKKNNLLGVEMESFVLFYLAYKLKKEATTILTVSDSEYETKKLTPLEREQSFDKAISLGLSAIIK